MSAPTPYERKVNFDDYAKDQGEDKANVLPNSGGQKLDEEFDTIKSSLNETITQLNLIQRTDGALKNGVVTTDSLSTQVAALMASATWTVRGHWATGTAYAVGDLVQNGAGGSTYVCAIAHASSAAIATDIGAGKWMFVGIGTLGDINGTLEIGRGGTGQTTAAGALGALSQSTLSIDPTNKALGIGMNGGMPTENLQIHDAEIPTILLSNSNTVADQGAALLLQSNNSPARSEFVFANRCNGSEDGFVWVANLGYRARLTGDGLLGIGNFNGIRPSSIIHAKKGTNSECAVQTTNLSNPDGLKMGIAPDGAAFIKQGENKDLTIWTNNTQRVVVDTLGNIAVGNSTPMNAPNYSFITLGNNTCRGGVDLQGPGYMSARFQMGGAELTIGTISSNVITFQTGNVERMRLAHNAAALYVGGISRNDSTGEVVAKNTAKAWVRFDGTAGSPTVAAGFNVASITKNATGDYTLTFTNALTDTNFAVAASASNGTNACYVIGGYDNSHGIVKTTGSVRFGIRRVTTEALTDVNDIMLTIFGS